MKNQELFMAGTSLALSAVSIGFSLFLTTRMEKMTASLNSTVGELANGINTNVKDEIINQAVDRAVKREVESRITATTEKIVQDIEFDTKTEIHNKVKKAVNASYDDIKDGVADKLHEQLGDINIKKIKNEVVENASILAQEKLEKEIKYVAKQFEKNLNTTSTVYEAALLLKNNIRRD